MAAGIRIKATSLDRAIAKQIVRRATPEVEKPVSMASHFAGERIVYAATVGIWLATRFGNERQQRQGNHLLVSMALAAGVKRVLKNVVTQERPDRRMVGDRNRRGIPKSGDAYDAFPSGHAVNLGVLAPALAALYPRARPAIWATSLLLAATRVVLLAHWASDVVTGFSIGWCIEYAIRRVTGADRKQETTGVEEGA
jgi:undecaprenyl-diphosphatase